MEEFLGLEKFLDVIIFAAEAHVTQTRKDAGQTPYIHHPLRVARLILRGLRESNGDSLPVELFVKVDCIKAAILHDTLEDCPSVTEEILRDKFGSNVTRMVLDVTDDPTLKNDPVARKKKQLEHAKELGGESVLIKLADKLDNLSSPCPPSWSPARYRGYILWSLCVAKNLPRAFGDQWLRTQLDSLATTHHLDLSDLSACLADLEKNYYPTLV